MADALAVEPGDVGAGSFTDRAAHRAALPPVYNRYLFTDADPIHDPAREAQQMLLWPLFFTSFLVADCIADFGAASGESAKGMQVLQSSASNKTAIGAAHLLETHGSLRVVGLTSSRNAPFVRSLGCYDDMAKLAVGTAVYFEIAGSRAYVGVLFRARADRSARGPGGGARSRRRRLPREPADPSVGYVCSLARQAPNDRATCADARRSALCAALRVVAGHE